MEIRLKTLTQRLPARKLSGTNFGESVEPMKWNQSGNGLLMLKIKIIQCIATKRRICLIKLYFIVYSN